MSNIAYKTRFVLIRIGKVLPFILCGLVLISYLESAIGLLFQNFILYNDYAIIEKPISYFIGSYFEYNISHLAVLCVLSIAISTCLYNKLSCAYLGVNLVEKSYFDFEIEPIYIYVICIVNIAIASYLIYRGVRNLTN